MSARRIRNWWWVDFRFDHLRYRVKSPSNKRADALSYEALLQSRLMQGLPLHGLPPPPPKPRFDETAARWMACYGASRTRSRQADYRYTIDGSLNPFFGRMRIDQIGTAQIERYKAKLIRQKLSPLTVNKKIGVLRLIIAASVEEGELEKLPKIKALRAPKSPYDVLNSMALKLPGIVSDGSDRSC
jgi:hypothetical protein